MYSIFIYKIYINVIRLLLFTLQKYKYIMKNMNFNFYFYINI